MDKEEKKARALQVDIREVLTSPYTCPKCGTSRKDKIKVRGNKLFCFKCNSMGFSVIDIVMIDKGINFWSAIDFLIGASFPIDGEKKQEQEQGQQQEKEKSIQQLREEKKLSYQKILEAHSPRNKKINDYLESRGVLKSSYRVPATTLDIKSHINNYGYVSIVYDFKKAGFCIHKQLKKKDGKRFTLTYGSPVPLLLAGETKDKILIVEGAEDGLTALELGYSALILNSVSNTKKAIKLIKDNIDFFGNKQLLVATDKDKAGLEAMDLLENHLGEKLDIWIFEELYKDLLYTKDLNQYFLERVLKNDK